MYGHFSHTKIFSTQKNAQSCKILKMAYNFNMPGKIQRHVLLMIDTFWAKERIKFLKIKIFNFWPEY